MSEQPIKKKIAVYPGTFDPVTYGHLDIITRSLSVFDRVIVAVAPNPQKQPLFDAAERLAMIQEACRSMEPVSAELFEGLLVEYARRKRATAILRGLRAVSDFEYELQIALVNQQLEPEIQTVFMMPRQEYTYLSSSVVKAVARHGGEVKAFVPDCVSRRLRGKFRKGIS